MCTWISAMILGGQDASQEFSDVPGCEADKELPALISFPSGEWQATFAGHVCELQPQGQRPGG